MKTLVYYTHLKTINTSQTSVKTNHKMKHKERVSKLKKKAILIRRTAEQSIPAPPRTIYAFLD
jgi:hypothetical protein